MANARPWPFDDEDRPSGSVRPLNPADLQAILAHLDQDPDQPLAAAAGGRVGRLDPDPGLADRHPPRHRGHCGRPRQPTRASAQPAGRRPGRRGGRLGLRFQPSPDTVAWRRGAAGERRTARLLGPLERQGWAVLHDLAVPQSRANVVSFQADQAARVLPDPGVAVVPIVAVHSAQVPWGTVVVRGVPVVSARHLPTMLRQLPTVLGPERVTALADQARVRFHAAA
jgi:hypothetical protein